MMQIRTATAGDTKGILEIYRNYVLHTAITFEYTVPTITEFQERIRHTLEKYPYLVAVDGDEIVGYAYAGSFHTRAAYGWSAELTVYVHPEKKRMGIGKMLYRALEDALQKMGLCNLYACIASPETEDEYLTHDSERFHARLGFEKVGEFHRCGYKFGRWYHMIWMEKLIGEHAEDQPPVKPFSACFLPPA